MRDNLQLLVGVGIALILILIAAEESSKSVPEPPLVAVAREKIAGRNFEVDTVDVEKNWREDEEDGLFEKLPREQFGEWDRIFPTDSLPHINLIRRIIQQFFAPHE